MESEHRGIVGWILLILILLISSTSTEQATITNSTTSLVGVLNSTTPSSSTKNIQNFELGLYPGGVDDTRYGRDNDFSDQDQVDQKELEEQQQEEQQKNKRKRRRRPLQLPNGASAATGSSSSVHSVILPHPNNNHHGNGWSGGCGAAPTHTPPTIPPHIIKDNLFGEEIGLIGGGLVAKGIAVAIGIGIIVIKIIIAAIIAWWWYGGDKKGGGGGGGDEGYGWPSPAPVYGPPKPVYGAPQPTYGTPVSGYGRQLYESMDFSRLSEKVLRALDFFEKYYYSNEVEAVERGKRAEGVKQEMEKKVD